MESRLEKGPKKKKGKKAAAAAEQQSDLQCSDEVVQFVAAKLAEPELDDELRRVLLRSCQAVWRSRNSERSLVLAEALALFFGSRLSSVARLSCLSCVEQVLLDWRVFPEPLILSLLKGCARSLWQSAATANSVIGVLWNFVRRAPPEALLSQLLTNFLVPVLSAEASDGRVQSGSFGSFTSENQCSFVRLFWGLMGPPPEKLMRAWLRCLADPSTNAIACETLLRVIHNVRGRLFDSVAKYFSFLGKVLFRQTCSVPRVVCLLIGEAVSPEQWPDSGELANAREVGLTAFENHLQTLLLDPVTAPNALLLLAVCNAPESMLAGEVQDAKRKIADRSALDELVLKRFF
jgi:hypothetical protein